MGTQNAIHVVGTGTIGEPLINLLLNLQQRLDVSEITFHKHSARASDRPRINSLMRRGAKLVVEADKLADFEKIGLHPSYTRQ